MCGQVDGQTGRLKRKGSSVWLEEVHEERTKNASSKSIDCYVVYYL